MSTPTFDEVDRMHTFVINDEGMYDRMQADISSDGNDLDPEYAWVRANWDLCTEVFGNVQSGRRRQHYLKYGG